MNTFLVIIAVMILILLLLQQYYQITLGVSPFSAPTDIAETITKAIRDHAKVHYSNSPKEPQESSDNKAPSQAEEETMRRFYVINSGLGNFVSAMATALDDKSDPKQWRVIGLEPNPVVWMISQILSIWRKNDNIRLYLRSLKKWPGNDKPDIIFCNLGKINLKSLQPQLEKAMQLGVTVLCYDETIHVWKPVKRLSSPNGKPLLLHTSESLPTSVDIPKEI